MAIQRQIPRPGTTGIRDAIARLIEESRSRPIVPFLGSGFSFSSGFPTITGVIDYLAKIDFAIQFDVYEHRYPRFLEGRDYKEHPSFFIEDFGWPSISALNADLWNWLARHDGEFAKQALKAAQPFDEQLFADLFGTPLSRDSSNASIARLEQRDYLTAIAQWSKRRVLSDGDSGTTGPLLREWRDWKRWYYGELQNKPTLLGGDWDEMLERICEGNLNLVDSLFTSFEKGRMPTLAHRYMSFLIDKLCIPLIMTTNFDSFLETALRDDGVAYRAFAIHRDASLPHTSLVTRQLSILKLHGSAYGLRVGERLNYPVEANARESIAEYLPEDALLLVGGFSGSERRMTQLLKSLALEGGRQEGLRMLWLEGPGTRRPMLQQFCREVGNRVDFASISDISTFLQEVFLTYGGGYQASRVPYEAIPGRPALSPSEPLPDPTPEIRKQRLEDARRPVHIYSAMHEENPSWAGLAVAQFAANCAKNGYSVLWIDMEKHHTVPGTVAEILQKARILDPESPNIALFLDDEAQIDNDSIQKAVKRIHEVLKHGKYVLVLDSLESYARPQFQHHGIPSFSLRTWGAQEPRASHWSQLLDSYKSAESRFYTRLNDLRRFLRHLLRWDEPGDHSHAFCDSYICVAIGIPAGRHRPLGRRKAISKPVKRMADLVNEFRSSGTRRHVKVHTSKSDTYGDLKIESRDATGAIHLTRTNANTWGDRKAAKERLHSFLKLKLELQAIQQAESKSEREHYVAAVQRNRECRDGLIGVLSVFRRPRSISAIRAMTERWLVGNDSNASASQLNSIRAAIDGIRDRQIVFGKSCTSLPFGMLHEGGSLWLFRETQISWYRSMTESLSTSKWVTTVLSKMKGDRPADPVETLQLATEALIDGLTCVALHIEASRVYYADTFMPTHDVDAFYEYLYHRCWSVRALSLMLAVLQIKFPRNVDPYRKAESVFRMTLEEVKNEMEGENRHITLRDCSPLFYLGTFSSLALVRVPKQMDQKAFAQMLRRLQHHCIVTLVQALHRQEEFLLQHATPETLDGWLSQIEQVVIPEVNGALFSPFFGGREWLTTVDKAALSKFSEFVGAMRLRLKRPHQGRVVNDRLRRPTAPQYRDFEQVRLRERRAKDAQEVACFLWSVLELEDHCRPWTFEQNPDGRSMGDLQPCYDARETALAYEVELRRVMRDAELDARHRSCALALRARAEYLLGHFRQAHHRLDLAAGGLNDGPVHRASRSLIHAYRAELLIYSADFHYSTVVRGSDRHQLSRMGVMKELRKIRRADREIRRALELVRDAEHLSRWRSLWNLGMAQIQLERLVFEAEALFIERTSIGSRKYAERFGVFEQILLDGLRALRSALDEMPYLEDSWDEAKLAAVPDPQKGAVRKRFFEFKVESKVWSLWRQFYVASAYFESLLGLYSRTPVLSGAKLAYQGDSLSVLNLVAEGAGGFQNDRWRYWNQAVRFDDFAKIEPFDGSDGLRLPRVLLEADRIRDDSAQSLCRLMISVMQDDLVGSDVIKSMWNRRRPLKSK